MRDSTLAVFAHVFARVFGLGSPASLAVSHLSASKRQRFATFPPLLAVQIRREVVGADWVPKKLEVTLHMPETLDLTSLKGTGIQPGEAAMEDDAAGGGGAAAAPAADAPVPEEALMMLMSMGFEQAKCEKALRSTEMNVERATEWIFSHMDDDGGEDAPAAAPAAAGEHPQRTLPLTNCVLYFSDR